MGGPDMEAIRDIPGYKVILKTVLKTQIQQLVEQLASYTDEESVILTASVSDGTLSHLGSDSGKFFLKDHEDIKSQFLGFCLKRYHARRIEEQQISTPVSQPWSPQLAHNSSLTHDSTSINRKRSITKNIPGHSALKSVRHEPYPTQKPARRNSEGVVDNFNPVLEASSFSLKDEADPTRNMDNDATVNQTVNTSDGESNNHMDPNVNVKLEADEDLEITGVEFSVNPATSDTSLQYDSSHSTQWGGGDSQDRLNSSLGYESTATTGSVDDSQPQPLYNKISKLWYCPVCGKTDKKRQNACIHLRIHTGVKPYLCRLCNKRFTQRHHLVGHLTSLHYKEFMADSSLLCVKHS